jgi:hypothetical protein
VAVAAGVLTPAVLAGSRFRRLFPDVYVCADVAPDLAVRSFAAAVLVGDRGVLGGYSAPSSSGPPVGRSSLRPRSSCRGGDEPRPV